ncbi:MAG: DUF1217 domain-containing protein [Janthinobacterium lividum]
MSGIGLSGLNVSMLFGGSSSDDNGIMSILAGNGGGASATNPIAALNSAEVNQTKDIAATAKDPQVARDLATFTKAVTGATSVTQLLANPTVMKILLTSNGLGDQVSYTALAQKALTSDLTNTNSVANQLKTTNSAWLSAAQTYQFAAKGLSVIQTPSVLATITNAYAEVTWRNSIDTATPGLSNALTFRAGAAKVTSVDQILGDPVLRDVVTTALGLPLQIAEQPLSTQEKLISNGLDVKRLQDPKFVETFVQRYLLAKGSNGTSGSSLVV